MDSLPAISWTPQFIAVLLFLSLAGTAGGVPGLAHDRRDPAGREEPTILWIAAAGPVFSGLQAWLAGRNGTMFSSGLGDVDVVAASVWRFLAGGSPHMSVTRPFLIPFPGQRAR
ncbi:hypothetical protein [Pseudarthrobacter sp. AB1]|uniref:hypothetical protein n=1 Tax=Pseudarthrobacter sp. AB1 TaxID=2138309 RepID=UPI00186B5B71|nr:hypothetical protein [Pseudarthrobacter sp. AB1]MBE4720102.1 hypothetical protein [Pseudarthrobacter sp. AB1]